MFANLIQYCMPEFIKKRKLKQLFRLTAEAFQCEAPELRKLTYRECMREYAAFTREQAEQCLQNSCTIEETRARLYQNAYLFGADLKRSLRIKSRAEAAAALQLIYKVINIDFQYDDQGKFVIEECYFSKYYSAEICGLISALDEGVAAGISGDGGLCFTQRITDGSSCCKGCIF